MLAGRLSGGTVRMEGEYVADDREWQADTKHIIENSRKTLFPTKKE